MEKCVCTSNKIKPNETCLFCCQKHLSAALALTNELNSIYDENLLRVASQIKLASWHFNTNFLIEKEKCDEIIQKILSFHEFKNELIELINHSYKLFNSNKNKTFNFNDIDINKKNINLSNYLNALLCISNSIELYKYEISYKDINMPYILGQLILASWLFQSVDKNYSLKIRVIYNEIKNDNFKIEELEEFKTFLWKKYFKGWIN